MKIYKDTSFESMSPRQRVAAFVYCLSVALKTGAFTWFQIDSLIIALKEDEEYELLEAITIIKNLTK